MAFNATFTSHSEEDTRKLAQKLIPGLSSGKVILLKGPIGAGKSVFARAIISHLLSQSNREEDIPSPTFTLVQSYQAGELAIWHADLYRIDSELEIIELGLEEAFETSLCIIEWGEKLGRFTPENPIIITFKPKPNLENRRIMTIETKDQLFVQKIEEALG